MNAITQILEADERVAFALLFGSEARGSARTGSDVDIAVGLRPGAALDRHALGGLVARLEAATGRDVQVIDVGTAPAPLSYRIFRDGVLLFERDHAALVEAKTAAILEYLDFQPVEAQCARGVLQVAGHG
jgi:predicted nucleotidyltransferase